MEYPIILQIERIYYPILSAVGVIVNAVAMIILSRRNCGLSKCITCYLLAMSAADLMLVIFDVLLNRINNIHFTVTFLHITPLCALRIVLFLMALDNSVWFTVAFTFDRFIAICFHNFKSKYSHKRMATTVIGAISIVSCLHSVPWYFVFAPSFVTDNVPWFCILTPEYHTALFWRVYEWIHSIMTPSLPIILILVFNILTVRNVIMSNRVRLRLRGYGNGESKIDPEIINRRKSIVLLFTLSANFIVLWMPNVVHSFGWQNVNYNYEDKTNSDPIFVFQEFGFMLRLLCSCTNTCIYILTQSKFREELKNGLKYSFHIIVNLCK
ncbi:probable G-protein coupled receptor 139 [Stegostoma tigrinum]|uniref:probable G-protein coupled receptor 139 n=1 Tax=Stegostoma tigrinum TaxID=3053191 RepID=UPI00202B37EF|nr:probable G-protein coupled receptor 139 [Stegostoma tigrinum]